MYQQMIIYASSAASAIRTKQKYNFILNHNKWLNKKKPLFGDLTRALYFAHGNLFEKYAIMECIPIINNLYPGLTFKPQEEKERELDIFEREYANMYLKYNAHKNFSFREIIGVKNEKYTNGYTVSARPDGLFNNHVLEVKCPLGQLYKKRGSGQTERGFDYSKEEFIIPYQYKFQMIIEMLCHKKTKGFFFQYYEPNGWKSFYHHLHSQYWNVDQLKRFDRVYKPWINSDDSVFTILHRGYKINPNIWKYYQTLVNIPDITLKPNGKVDTKQKDSFEAHRDEMEFILSNINVDRMVKDGYTRREAMNIKRKLTIGSGMKVGTVYKNEEGQINIDWGGDAMEWMSYKQYQLGITHLMKHIYISRKDIYTWETFINNLPSMSSKFPDVVSPIEHVLIELDMSKYIQVDKDNVSTKDLDVFHDFLKKYNGDSETLWKMVKPLKKWLEDLPIKVLHVYRGQSQSQKDIEFIKMFLKDNPEKYNELLNYIEGKSEDTLISVEAIKKIFKQTLKSLKF